MAKDSRPDRWGRAVAEARTAFDAARAAAEALGEALGALDELRGEYEEWRDNTPENAQSSPTYEKLEAVADLSFEWSAGEALDDAEGLIDEAENADLPKGFGRD